MKISIENTARRLARIARDMSDDEFKKVIKKSRKDGLPDELIKRVIELRAEARESEK